MPEPREPKALRPSDPDAAAAARRRSHLRRRYLSLGTGELAAATMFTVVTATLPVESLRTPPGRLALWAAVVPLVAVLVQGGTYWLLARSWVGVAPMPAGLARLYRALRMLDGVLLVVAAVGLAIWAPRDALALGLVVLVWLFAVAEYVNYFHVRLSFPLRRWPAGVRELRPSRLALDLAV